MEIAQNAWPKLKEIAEAAVAHVVKSRTRQTARPVLDSAPPHVVCPNSKIKGLRRALQKAQEEYNGDYSRILDYCRISIVCATLQQTKEVLDFFIDETLGHHFQVCRVKDRISRVFDTQLSGGSRDMLVNGWLEL